MTQDSAECGIERGGTESSLEEERVWQRRDAGMRENRD